MTFLEKYQLLKKSIPVPAVMADKCIDCDYGDGNVSCKNGYYIFDGYYFENCTYTSFGAYNKMLVDCHSMLESEKSYESLDGTKCHSCTYTMDCNSCTDCHFSANLNSCNDCFGCVALTHKKYCINNQQFTKEEYFKRIEELKNERSPNES